MTFRLAFIKYMEVIDVVSVVDSDFGVYVKGSKQQRNVI